MKFSAYTGEEEDPPMRYTVHDHCGRVADRVCKNRHDAVKTLMHITEWNPDSRCTIIEKKVEIQNESV